MTRFAGMYNSWPDTPSGIQMEGSDIVVIGAGIHGLATGSTYLKLDPRANLLLLEAEASLGGVWSKRRLYPGLKSNNMFQESFGTFEFSDFPMSKDAYKLNNGKHIPGIAMHNYLMDYARISGVLPKIRFNIRVQSVEKKDEKWHIYTENGLAYTTSKLVISTGLTSRKFIPEISGIDTFGAPAFHSEEFLTHESLLKSISNVTVYGGGKSAWDCVNAFANAGVKIDWIIRESGNGPHYMAPSMVTALKIQLEKLITTRALTWASPCVWGDQDGFSKIRELLHGTAVGRWVVDKIWSIVQNEVNTPHGFGRHPELEKLRPWYSPFWVGAGLGIFNYEPGIFEYFQDGQIRVHIDTICKVSPKAVHLSSGKKIITDALVFCTGWKHRPSLKLPPELLPNFDHDAWIEKADEHIWNAFPRLTQQPKSTQSISKEPLYLYRFMVPPLYAKDNSIAFSGMCTTANTTLCAQSQALWIAAYLAGKLHLKSKSEAELKWETILHNRFGLWRYPAGNGSRYPDFIFDAIPYFDLLLRDLGLQVHRKSNIFKECFEPYGVADYRGIVEEWKARQAT